MKTKTDSTNFHLSLILAVVFRSRCLQISPKTTRNVAGDLRVCFQQHSSVACCVAGCGQQVGFVNYIISVLMALVIVRFLVLCHMGCVCLLVSLWMLMEHVATPCSYNMLAFCRFSVEGKSFFALICLEREFFLLSFWGKFSFQYVVNLNLSWCQMMT